MALMLCHQCLAWVEPLGEQCPQCDYPLDARSPDPGPDVLGSAIGRLVSEIGKIRLVRTALPGVGLLYETTNGLFFVPDRLEQVRMVRRKLSEPFRALLQAARGSSGPSKPDRERKRMEVSFDRPATLGPDDSDKLAALLMQNPGVFFLSKRSIVNIRRSLWSWTIYRPNGLVLRFKPANNRNGVHERMTLLAAAVADAVCS